ncbi:4-hydroxythreonine-4-phosphate dehydrogenase PdxA [Halalkalibacterium halodurans]|uniref:4-hydroxythreonine-4-phosphate dehydrogenase PdxA n=1 Tax=Halalkalibacterium halodurans TaxID=86665 RepID=UPI002E1FB0C9|nr:4-hydroxythreonine-4-phosphate dehydrogenase PdxA [Halalkalibacterium halodurans]MED4083294.1 4-hydroxythreonine-4-phosphate dehydrogenase PdxA [Halalkalibacterium halodurans]MED4106515.1 4-hydroxythreonine-4-phosphate dehydrogenase PdxA [Halalkalibacterium halodurans]MED4108750.1 4-hydroxythreonine-4-phosphate dehydrogenase PdxA [Halalkalibacterium halodurans]MED4150009.1 4-hydroxythreonine-4-phosphate dehydrogenase PdxA [Halalkalibacterium halodurans]
MNKKPIIAIPMGDPAGIGPEITVGALNKKELYDVANPVVIGHGDMLEKMLPVMKADLTINRITTVDEAMFEYGTIDVIHLDNLNVDEVKMGTVQAQCGKAAFEYIRHAVQLANDKKVDALATTPINKESLKAAEVPYIGHTEMLADLTKTEDPLTMFEVHSMRIFFLTRHLSLKDAIDQMTKERVHDYLLRCDKALEKLGVKERRFAVAGLNPHSGENGLFGREEMDEITPGIELAKKDGINAVGPVPADSVFHHALNGRYDAVLSLYHDQGHIAAKMTDFERTISITNGLPFLRTSVDHGTAFDIAGKGIASTVSMEECIKLAAKYAPHFVTA